MAYYEANPNYSLPGAVAIDMDKPNGVRTTISTTDPSPALWADVVAGKYGAVAAYAAPAVPPARLLAYAGARRDRVADAGISVAVSGGTAQVDTDARGLTYLSGVLASFSAPFNATSATWYQSGGNLTLSAADVAAIALAAKAHVNASFATWATVGAAIEATPPTITTMAEIDAAGWPAN